MWIGKIGDLVLNRFGELHRVTEILVDNYLQHGAIIIERLEDCADGKKGSLNMGSWETVVPYSPDAKIKLKSTWEKVYKLYAAWETEKTKWDNLFTQLQKE